MLPGRVRSNVLARRRSDWVTITRSTNFDRSFEHSMRPRPPVATAERMAVAAAAAEQQQGPSAPHAIRIVSGGVLDLVFFELRLYAKWV